MRTVGLKVNAPIGPHGRREGMVEGLEERGGILRTRIPLQREVFFSLAQLTRYMVCSALI